MVGFPEEVGPPLENIEWSNQNWYKERKVSKDIAKDRNAWKSFIRNSPINANMENRCLTEYDDDINR